MPFRIRRQRLRTHFPPITPDAAYAARFAHVECCESTDGKEAVEEFWQKSVESRAEGLMIKVCILHGGLFGCNGQLYKPIADHL